MSKKPGNIKMYENNNNHLFYHKREETEDNLLTLLEDTCSKLQTASQF